ncbi:MAG: hypothetical protein WD492_07005 [Alkalispirochaeta sp.]
MINDTDRRHLRLCVELARQALEVGDGPELSREVRELQRRRHQ